MSETTRPSGGLPDIELVQALRRRALNGIDILGLLSLIAEYLQFPDGELRRLILIQYLRKAFSLSLKDLSRLVYSLDRTTDRYTTDDPDFAAIIEASIAASRDKWCNELSG